ncbi:MAG: ABC transporter substrate-binding protein [Deltaproteobacteria bacterium]|nr:ABC transporter substrate-binding protein [Deltaproteobacteria bacterium]
MRKPLVGLQFLIIVFSFIYAPQVCGGTPLEAVRTKVDGVLNVLRDPSLKNESAEEIKKKRLWSIIDELFDYSELSRRTLGKNWAKLNLEQQKEFSDLFSTHLGNVYIDRILAYSDEKVVFDKERRKKKRALVYSRVVMRSKEIPIDYRMIQKNGQWKVYDVVIEGVSLVKNYRSQFREMLKKKNPEYLLETLRKKVGDKV